MLLSGTEASKYGDVTALFIFRFITRNRILNMETTQKKLIQILNSADLEIARLLDAVLQGHEVTVDEGTMLMQQRGNNLRVIMAVADELRRQAVGDVVTYVVNRNINFTNVCIKRCGFCAFSRGHREEEGYFLPMEEIVRRAQEAWDLGATEICVQAGLPPKMDGYLYMDLCREIKKVMPDMHIHGFSPEEVLYGAVRAKISIEEYLQGLKEAGVGSLPGTSAEILDDTVRDVIAPGRISTKDWIRVIKGAHKIGIPTTSTIMYGHVETVRQRAAHIALVRDIQKETGGFTEFVPLSFVYYEAPMHFRKLVDGVRNGATGNEVLAMYAVSRLMLFPHIKNIQVSWVKEGHKFGQICLDAGVNDMGGTLINESISTSAGAGFGQLLKPKDMRELIRDAGRIPAERNTIYGIKQLYPANGKDELSALDRVSDVEQRFSSFHQLIKDDRFRYKKPLPVTLTEN
jgi:7,8-didemethyl-8-hydroxy-5-deazariboflavin synthase CofH subunit